MTAGTKLISPAPHCRCRNWHRQENNRFVFYTWELLAPSKMVAFIPILDHLGIVG